MKKGFTLIELLAVIIILAIIALIAVPTILDIINKSKTKTTEISEKNYIRGIENCIISKNIEDGNKKITDLNSSCKDYIKGNLPTRGNVTIKNGEVTDYELYFNDKTEETKSYKVGDTVYYNPVSNELNCSSYTETNSQNENKTGCMKWYVIANNDETMNLLLDHNTTYKVAWNSSGKNTEGPVTVNEKLASDVSSWSNEAKNTARLITADEVWSITSSTNGATNWSSSTSTSSFYFEGSKLSGAGTSKYAWLFDYTRNCTSYGCNKAANNTYGYWTSSPSAGYSSYAWRVDQSGNLDSGNVGVTINGVRPVITISKS